MIHSLHFIFPELILLTAGLTILLADLFEINRKILGFMAILAILIAIIVLPGTMEVSRLIFSGMISCDLFSFFMRTFVLLCAASAVLMSMGFNWPDHENQGEYYFFLLVATIAMMLTVSAGNLLLIYLGVETLSIISYILACSFKKDFYSTEAGLKYFLFGSLSTGIMLYGISLVYGLMGTLDLSGIGLRLAESGQYQPSLILAAIMVFAGIAFKASLVPFHMWVADVYEGAPWPVAAFFSIGPKALGFALFIKIFFTYTVFITSNWTWIAVILAIATMTMGNLAAFHQTSVKRLLAFSSVAQAGYILAGIASGTMGLNAAFFYLIIYAFMNMGAFACAAFLSVGESSDIITYQGMGRRAPLAAAIFSIFLMSLAGLPPLAGFMAKFLVTMAAVNTSHYVLAGAIVTNSVVAFFYYLKIIKAMFFDAPLSAAPINIHLCGVILLILCLLAVVFFGIFPQSIIETLTIII